MQKTYLAQSDPAPIFDPGNTGGSDVQTGVDQIRDVLDPTGITGTDSLSALIIKYVNFALPYLALAAFLAFVYAGFLYVTAYGNDDQIGKAKKIMIYTVVGIIVVILSYAIVSVFTTDLVQGLQS